MARCRKKLSFVSALLVLGAIASLPLLADTHRAQTSSSSQFHCYCQCEAKGEHRACSKKMCELPKYENRWWAVSCHKPAAETSTQKQQPSAPEKKQTRNTLDARR